uniref:DUF7041 domain-containing protein n=1 Tax=Bracon brevicornis TaxID=1563983 RepID=A0A6V7KUZ3_9HYME
MPLDNEADSTLTANEIAAALRALFQNSADATSAVNNVIRRDKPKIIAQAFNKKPPSLWFAQLELQFRQHAIDTEEEKFMHTAPLIESKIAMKVESFITAPSDDTPYTDLKEAIIKAFTTSEESRIQLLLDHESLGDRKPLQHLRYLRTLVPECPEKNFEITMAISPSGYNTTHFGNSLKGLIG